MLADIKLSNNISYKKIKDIATIHRGIRVVKKELSNEGKYPVFQNSLRPMGYYNLFNETAGKVYVISAGAAGEIGFCDTDFWAADDCLVISSNGDVLNKFVYYFLLQKKEYILSHVRKASIPRLSKEIIENIEIPVFSVNEQEMIIKHLDDLKKKTVALINELEREKEMRERQFDFYLHSAFQIQKKEN